MNKRIFIFLIPILMVAGLYSAPRIVTSVHGAATGVVCIAPDGSTSCPTLPPLITGSLPPTRQLRIAVVINSSDSLNGFDITLFADHNILKPVNASLQGTVLPGVTTILLRCIGGVLDRGPGCASTDTIDTLHLSVSANNIPTPPVTGLLFTANYTILGATPNTPIRFQTGCTVNVSVQPNVCIGISNGSAVPVMETSQAAKFSNQQYFDLQLTFGLPPSLVVSRGGPPDNSLAPLLTSVNGFAGTVTLAAQVLPSSPIVATLNPTTVILTPGGTGSSQLTVTVPSSTNPGNYTVTITGTPSTGAPPNAPPGASPNTIAISLLVPPPDFTIRPTIPAFNFNVSETVKATIILSSVGGFTGPVDLTVTASPGLTATLNKTRLTLTTTAPNSTTVKITASVPAKSLTVNVTGTAGTHIHTAMILLNVRDFVLSVPATLFSINEGSSRIQTVIVDSALSQPYNVSVTLGTVYVAVNTPSGPAGPSTGVSVNCFPKTLSVVTIGNPTPGSTTCTVNAVTRGNYTVTIVGTSGTVSHAVAFPVIVFGADFSLTASDYFPIVSVGSTTNLNIHVTSLLSFNGKVSSSFQVLSGGTPRPTLSANATDVMLDTTNSNRSIAFSITAGGNTPSGVYAILFAATSQAGTSTLRHTITIQAIVVSTSSSHDLAINSITPSTQTASVGSKITFTVNVGNLGKQAENATVVALVADQTVDTKNVTLAPGENKTIVMTWDTSHNNAGSYMVGAKVLAVPGETNTGNNLMRAATPVTLSSANTSPFQSGLLLPLGIIAVVIIAILAAIFLYFLPRRRTTTTTTV